MGSESRNYRIFLYGKEITGDIKEIHIGKAVIPIGENIQTSPPICDFNEVTVEIKLSFLQRLKWKYFFWKLFRKK